MADNTPLNTGSGGDTIATDDIGGVKFQRIKLVHGPDGTNNGDIAASNPLPGILGLDSPKTTYATSAALAAGGSTDLDSTQVTSTKTGELVAIYMGSSAALKGELKTVLNGAESAVKAVLLSRPGEVGSWVLPSKKFYTQVESATAGFDGFRLTITNLDTSEAADVYATYLYDEV